MRPTSLAFTYFAAVATHGSIREAAETLNVASSAVGRKIAELETSLGVPLFQRLPRGVRLTSAGELLLGHIRRVGRDFELVQSQIEDLRGLRRGHVRLAIIEGVANFVASRIAAFQKTHPRVTFEFAVTGAREVVSAVVREEAEIGFAFNPPPDRHLRVIKEVNQTLHAVMARAHPLATRNTLRLADCMPFAVLVGDESLGGRHLLDAAAESASVELRPMAVGNSISVMRTVASKSEAICFQIEIGTDCDPSLVAIPLNDRQLCGRLVLNVRRDRQLPAVTALFLEDLSTCLADRQPPQH
jgi:DNA-binding transcriptional LysR family regulator